MTTAPTDTESALLAAIAAAPAEHWRKHVLADWLTEQGRDNEAEAWRWLAAWEREPRFIGWWPAHRRVSALWPESTLPFHAVGEWDEEGVYRHIKDPREAYLAAVTEYIKHRTAGWRPEWPEGVRESL